MLADFSKKTFTLFSFRFAKKMNAIWIVFLSCLWIGINAENCPAIYLRYSPNHTFCLAPNNACKIHKRLVDTRTKEQILQVHNNYRSRVACGDENEHSLPSARCMLKMEWDEELAEIAQRHADQCIFQHDCNDCRRVKDFDVGQNLFELVSTKVPSENEWPRAIGEWYDEAKYLQKEEINSFQGGEGPPATGHFTQLVWASSWKIGCGFTLYERQGEQTEYVAYYACNYGPAGNVKDEPIYKKGDPCSDCPINSCCGEECEPPTYPGLCKILGDSGPQYKMPSGYLFRCTFKGEPDCSRRVTSGVDRWMVSQTLSGNYIGIVINGGESSTLNFTHAFGGPKTMCLTSHFRKGPQISGQDGKNSAHEILRILEANYEFKTEMNQNSVDFIKYDITLNWGMKTTLTLDFRVPDEAPAQYLEVKDIVVTEGKCS